MALKLLKNTFDFFKIVPYAKMGAQNKILEVYMSLSVVPLLQDLGNMSSHLAEKKKRVHNLEYDVNQVSDLRKKITRDLKAHDQLDWDNEEGRALLDTLYKLDAFQSHKKIYRFESAQEALPLLEAIDAHYSDIFDHLKIEQKTMSEKQSYLEQYRQEISRIISQLSQCLSIVNR